MQWARFLAAAGWGFNENKVSEFTGKGPQIAFLAPEGSIQQKDPTLGNEELKAELLINTVTGGVAFGRAGTFNFDNPSKLDSPPTSPEPTANPIQLEEPPYIDFEVGE